MRKLYFFLLFVCLLGILTGCREEMESQGNAEQFDLYSETEQIFDVDVRAESRKRLGEQLGDKVVLLGMQFFQGEPVQLWGIWNKASGTIVTDIYLYRQDGSGECMIQGLPSNVCSHSGILDEEGCFYSRKIDAVEKYDIDGNLVYASKKEGFFFTDICQLSDKSIALLVSEQETQRNGIWLMDTATGDFSEVGLKDSLEVESYLGTGQSGLLILDRNGVWEVEVKEGKRNNVLPFLQTSFSLQTKISAIGTELEDFRMTGEGSVEILWADAKGQGQLETLQKGQPEEGKTTLVIRGLYVNNRWLKEQISEFNQTNEKYYVTVEARDGETEEEDFMAQTSVQLATGKGADIIYGDALGDSVYSLIQKGVFENLKPYMEASGIKEENYFKAAFDCLRVENEVYGVLVSVGAYGETLDGNVFESGEEPDAEGILNALLSYEEKAIYRKGFYSEDIVRSFLQGSESLWGMIDWESHTCDFDESLFTKLLDVAKRYGYDERNNYPAVAEYRSDGFYSFKSDEQLREEGKSVSGFLFDDGCHGMVSTTSIMMVNANSENKEGAWEFIRFLLSEEVQSALGASPASKKAFREQAQKEIEEGAVVEIRDTNGAVTRMKKGDEDLTEEKAAEIEAFLEEARPLPVQIVPILDIICEESQDYFNDVKSAEDVVQVIENRIQVYLMTNS